MSTKLKYTKKNLLKWVPPKYHSIIDVFMKFNTDIVAKHQEKWNYKIHLKKGKKTLYVRNYKPLTEQKTKAIKKYIDKHLAKNFIWSSLSAAASPILLVYKPEEDLRFYIDYPVFNAVTVKNKHSIPLIFETLRKLMSAIWYTKLDVINTFNRIKIKKNHK